LRNNLLHTYLLTYSNRADRHISSGADVSVNWSWAQIDRPQATGVSQWWSAVELQIR